MLNFILAISVNVCYCLPTIAYCQYWNSDMMSGKCLCIDQQASYSLLIYFFNWMLGEAIQTKREININYVWNENYSCESMQGVCSQILLCLSDINTHERQGHYNSIENYAGCSLCAFQRQIVPFSLTYLQYIFNKIYKLMKIKSN